jgi:hypothetical protein
MSRGRSEGSFVALPESIGPTHKIKVEPTTGIEPVNLFLTKEVLYLLSYVGLRESSQHDWKKFIV